MLTLTRTRMRSAVALVLCILSIPAGAQERYEVVAVKPSAIRDISEVVPGLFQPNGQWSAHGATLAILLQRAYGVPSSRIVGSLPPWAYSDRFDIVTTPLPGRPLDQLHAAAQQLLADRFGLRTHWELRTTDVYALVRASQSALGSGLRTSQRSCDRTNGSADRPAADPCAESFLQTDTGTRRYHLRDRPLGDLLTLSSARTEIGDPIVDRTGLIGRFDVDFEFTPSSTLARSGPDASVPYSTAIADQLGLRFEKRQEPVQILVIEQVTPPSLD
jgi:uncharacterized protein (TIGR03435 family)